MKIREAKQKDAKIIEQILKSNALPSEDFVAHLNNFYLYEDKNKIVGLAGYELCGSYALLRSFAVLDEYKGLCLARKLYEALKNKAQKEEINSFYLLTETASKYFEKLGFEYLDREKAPLSIENTEQFKSICPNSAQLMYLDLLR